MENQPIFSKISYQYPEPNIHTGVSLSNRHATVVFNIDIYCPILIYDSIDFKGVSINKPSLEDVEFMNDVYSRIIEINGQKLAYILSDCRVANDADFKDF